MKPKNNFTSYSAFTFDSISVNPMFFSVELYSKLKFGSDYAAKTFGYRLAESFFANYSEKILSHEVLVFASPYNYVKNAATIMTEHFINKLNHLLVNANGTHCRLVVFFFLLTKTRSH
jgi:hypothetical protein